MPEQPLTPPPAHPDEPPFVCIQINESWIPYIIGLLRPAKFPEYWAGTLDENRNARRDIQNLIDQFQVMEACGDMNICCEPQIYIFRINSETGRMERSPDSGSTWIPDPTDPIHIIHQNPPVVRPTVDSTKCDAATNALEHIEDIITLQSENIGTAVTVFELAAAVAGFLLEVFIIIVTGGAGSAPGIAIITAIWAAASAALTEGKTAFDDYWTNDAKDKILCALYCNIEDNGQFTQLGWEAAKHQMRRDLTPSPALDFAMTAFNAGGYVGINQMASYGNASAADCAACACDNSCASKWSISFTSDNTSGHIVSRDEITQSIVVESTTVSGDGHYYVIILTPDENDCCIATAWTPDPLFSDPGTPAWIECGNTQAGLPFVSGLIGSRCVNGLLWKGDAPFKLNVALIAC